MISNEDFIIQKSSAFYHAGTAAADGPLDLHCDFTTHSHVLLRSVVAKGHSGRGMPNPYQRAATCLSNHHWRNAWYTYCSHGGSIGLAPIDIFIKGEAAMASLRLNWNGSWRKTSHPGHKNILKAIKEPLLDMVADIMPKTLPQPRPYASKLMWAGLGVRE